MNITLDLDMSLSAIQSLDCWKSDQLITHLSPLPASNMNVVLRVHTNLGTYIAKQSRPFVRKFPQIPAPIERIEVENFYFKTVHQNELLREMSPKIHAWYPANHLLILEDLGNLGDFTEMYSGDKVPSAYQLKQLIQYLEKLHQLCPENFPENPGMRKLNHEHIFNFPFDLNNGFDLSTIQHGLQELSLRYKTDNLLKKAVYNLGKQYLSQGTSLLHGDFYPGSWMDGGKRVYVIDPEFAFVGAREFDLGVLLAHADFAGVGTLVEESIRTDYGAKVDLKLMEAYRGVELMRRLIGIAQLPLALSLEQKGNLLEKARQAILSRYMLS